MPKSAQRQFLVTVGTLGLFATKGGGNVTSELTKVYDGGKLRPDLISGPSEADNITVSRPYDPLRDAGIIASLRQQVGSYTATLSVQQTDRTLRKIGSPTVYPDALLVGLTEPEFNADSGDAAMFELEFAISDFV